MFDRNRDVRWVREVCPRCDKVLDEGQKVCECGSPTPFMSFDERRYFELEQWRARRAAATG